MSICWKTSGTDEGSITGVGGRFHDSLATEEPVLEGIAVETPLSMVAVSMAAVAMAASSSRSRRKSSCSCWSMDDEGESIVCCFGWGLAPFKSGRDFTVAMETSCNRLQIRVNLNMFQPNMAHWEACLSIEILENSLN